MERICNNLCSRRADDPVNLDYGDEKVSFIISFLGYFLFGWFLRESRRAKKRIAKLEKASEDLETIAWSVGCDLYETYDDSGFADLEEAGIKLKAACESYHQVLAGEPLTKTKK